MIDDGEDPRDAAALLCTDAEGVVHIVRRAKHARSIWLTKTICGRLEVLTPRPGDAYDATCMKCWANVRFILGPREA